MAHDSSQPPIPLGLFVRRTSIPAEAAHSPEFRVSLNGIEQITNEATFQLLTRHCKWS